MYEPHIQVTVCFDYYFSKSIVNPLIVVPLVRIRPSLGK